MSQKLLVNDSNWVENISEFDEIFIIKGHNEEIDEGYLLEIDIQHPKNLHNLHNGLFFFPEGMKIKKVKKLVGNLHDKINMLCT